MHLTVDNDLNLTAADFLEASVNIFGIRGSGKSYTMGVLCEAFITAGKPFSIIDPLKPRRPRPAPIITLYGVGDYLST